MSGKTGGPGTVPGGTEELPAEEKRESPPASMPVGLSAGPIRHMQDVFSNPWRQAILYHLTEADGPVSLTELTRHLVVRACERESGARSLDTMGLVNHTRHRLRQGHVAELAAFGLVVFDSDSGTVRLAEDVSLSVTPPWE